MKIYFAGLAGTALAPLADLMLQAGHQVFGSDLKSNSATDQLVRQGVIFSQDQSGRFLRQVAAEHGIDWLVHTSSIDADHPEIKTAQALGLKITKRGSMIAQLIKDQGWQLIAVAGTHGKTSTTSMLIWLGHQLGLNFSYLVGSSLSFGPAGRFNQKSKYFVYECDEYDNNFLHFYPDFSLIPTIDHDHVDIFPNKAAYEAAFRQFLQQSGKAWLWQNQKRPPFADLDNLYFLEQIDPRLKLIGTHNRANASLVLALAQFLELANDETLIEILNHSPNAGRRFEVLSRGLISDYAHHPVEIEATLQLAQEYAKQKGFHRLVVVYQPHQNSRQYQVREAYPQAFRAAQQIYWLPTFLAREDPTLATLSVAEQIQDLSQAQAADLDQSLIKKLQEHLQQGDLVIGMSAGNLDQWLRDHLDAICKA